jgi:hypothetical protein
MLENRGDLDPGLYKKEGELARLPETKRNFEIINF